MTKEEIIETVLANREILRRYRVKSISLFGSYVRNEQREDSDIDFFVEFQEDTYNNFINLVYSLEDLFKKRVTVVSAEDLSPHIRPYVLKEAEKIEGG
jgi:predicted nucleotidyltransferase